MIGQLFVYTWLIVTFPLQLLSYLIGKSIDRNHRWWDSGAWRYLDDFLLPNMQTAQDMINMRKKIKKARS